MNQNTIRGENKAHSRLTESERADINENDISETFFSREDTSLNSGTVSDSLIGVDSLGGLLSVEVFLKEFLNTGDTSGTSDETTETR
jgi:hypothetical protein